MNREQRISKKLSEKLEPEFLQVNNNSALHKGHLGDDGTNETHFLITIKSLKLKDLNRIKSHRTINDILQDEFKNGLHALEIKILP